MLVETPAINIVILGGGGESDVFDMDLICCPIFRSLLFPPFSNFKSCIRPLFPSSFPYQTVSLFQNIKIRLSTFLKSQNSLVGGF